MQRSRPCADGSLLTSSRWLKGQLQARFARRIEDFVQLPHVVVSNPQFNAVLLNHLETYNAVADFPEILIQEQAEEFREVIAHQLGRRADCARMIADGYKQVRHLFPHIRLDSFLHDLFTSGIATRILMENFVNPRREGCAGVVRRNLSPLSIVRDRANELMALTAQVYGASPEIVFRGNVDCAIDYIPRHASYMIQEVLKNALRATVERHWDCATSPLGCFSGMDRQSLPPVVVELQRGDAHVFIKVSDQGGGLSKEALQEAYQYGSSTAASQPSRAAKASWNSPDPNRMKALAGFGFGLPLTKLHAQFFGGDVFMQAMPGHGTDVIILLTNLKDGEMCTEVERRMAAEANERLERARLEVEHENIQERLDSLSLPRREEYLHISNRGLYECRL